MILRKPSPETNKKYLDWGTFVADSYDGWGKQASLRWRVAMLTASMVAIAVGVMTVLAYWSVSVTLTNNVDTDLQALRWAASHPLMVRAVESGTPRVV